VGLMSKTKVGVRACQEDSHIPEIPTVIESHSCRLIGKPRIARNGQISNEFMDPKGVTQRCPVLKYLERRPKIDGAGHLE